AMDARQPRAAAGSLAEKQGGRLAASIAGVLLGLFCVLAISSSLSQSPTIGAGASARRLFLSQLGRLPGESGTSAARKNVGGAAAALDGSQGSSPGKHGLGSHRSRRARHLYACGGASNVLCPQRCRNSVFLGQASDGCY